jgi:hypothetical protein
VINAALGSSTSGAPSLTVDAEHPRRQAGEDRDGKKVLTRERLERFYNGSLFYQFAEEVAARRASEWAMLRGATRSGTREIY